MNVSFLGIKTFILGRYGSLLAALVLLMLLQPTVDTSIGKFILEALFIAVLFAGLRAVHINKTVLRLLFLCLLLSLAGTILGTMFDLYGLFAFGLLLRCFFLATVGLVILVDLFSRKQVTGDTLAGAVCVYLLIAITWSFGYLLTEYFVPGSFSFTEGHGRLNLWLSQDFYPFFYFSLVTMTTVGYGDMAPVTTEARTLATMEALTGQIYLTILVARLVGMHLAQSLGQRDRP